MHNSPVRIASTGLLIALLSWHCTSSRHAPAAPQPPTAAVSCPCPREPAAPAAPAAQAATPAPAATEAPRATDQAGDALVLERVDYAALPGWQEDAVNEAVPALARSCERLAGLAPAATVGRGVLAGTAADWQPLCTALRRVDSRDTAAARAFFETWLVPHVASNRGEPVGRFTGYYVVSLRGARKRGGPYQTPIYARPPELVMVNVLLFHDAPQPRRLAGRVENGSLVPYASRQEIAAGALAGRGLELFWVTEPIDAFFAEIQGSAVVELPGGSTVHIGYAGQNGHAYTAIGRVLVAEGEIPAEELSMQAIRRWLEANPTCAQDMMNRNPSFVFFRELGPRDGNSSQGVRLTPGRSLAVDSSFIPLSSPVFVDTEVPVPGKPGAVAPWRRLVIAQDTGGAIQGPVRGDIFFGQGELAAELAGRLRSRGRYFVLVPRPVAERLDEQVTPGRP